MFKDVSYIIAKFDTVSLCDVSAFASEPCSLVKTIGHEAGHDEQGGSAGFHHFPFTEAHLPLHQHLIESISL